MGLLLGRSADLIVGLFGILKAGAAYVPLDPEYPERRLRYIVEDSRMPLVVTSAALASRFFLEGVVETILLDRLDLRDESPPTLRLAVRPATSPTSSTPRDRPVSPRAR